MFLRNVSPLGHLHLPLVGRDLGPGEIFEVDDVTGATLLDQPANFAPAPDPDDGPKSRRGRTADKESEK